MSLHYSVSAFMHSAWCHLETSFANKEYPYQTAIEGADWIGYALFAYAFPNNKHFHLCQDKMCDLFHPFSK